MLGAPAAGYDQEGTLQEQIIPARENGRMNCSLFLLILKDQRSLDLCLGDAAPKILTEPREASEPVVMYSQVLAVPVNLKPFGMFGSGLQRKSIVAKDFE